MFSRSRWSAFGAAVAVTLAGGVAIPSAGATITSGERAVFVPITPCRLLDTRADGPVGPRTTPIGNAEVHTQAVTGTNGNCTIPGDATAVAMNVTAVNPTASSFLTIWPADAGQPLASSLNWTPASPPTPNKVDVKLSADGRINMFNLTGSIDILADVVGYYADHNHDDRYYSRGRVDQIVAAVDDTLRSDTYSPHAMAFLTPIGTIAPTFSAGGCMTNSTPTSQTGTVALTLPVGARLTSVEMSMHDATVVSAYSVFLRKATLTTTGVSNSNLATASGGGPSNVVVKHVLTPGFEVVDPDEAFFLDITGLLNNGNGFCHALVTYDTKQVILPSE